MNRKTDKRSIETRRSLIDASIRLIGQHGFDGMTLRQLAHEAGANLAAVRYHFGSKAGLQEAAIEAVAQRIAEVGPARFLAGLTPESIDRLPPDAARNTLKKIMLAGVKPFENDRTMREMQLFFERELTQPGEAANQFYNHHFKYHLALLARLVSRMSGDAPDSQRSRLKALALMGQAMVFRQARPLALLAMGWTDYGEAELSAIGDAFWLTDDSGSSD